jgi:hypothetical protein
LVNLLTTLNLSTPEIDDAGHCDAFTAEDRAPKFEAGLLPTKPPNVSPVMRENVRRGSAALPIRIGTSRSPDACRTGPILLPPRLLPEAEPRTLDFDGAA